MQPVMLNTMKPKDKFFRTLKNINLNKTFFPIKTIYISNFVI